MCSACPPVGGRKSWAQFTEFSVKGMLSQKGQEASPKAEKLRSSPRNADQSAPPAFALETPVS